MKVIIAEDNKRESREICNIIEESGLPLQICETFSNGLEAFEYLKSHDIDILVSDIQMPKLNGINLIKAINEENIPTKVMFVTCYDSSSYLMEAINNNVASYILKPIDENKLIQKLQSLIADLEKEETLRNSIKQNEKVKKLATVQALINFMFDEKDKMTEKLLNQYITHKFKTVVLVEIEDNDQFATLMPNDSYETSALKIFINQLNTNEINFYPISINTTSLAVVITTDNKDANIPDILTNFQSDTVSMLGMNVKFGISNTTTDISELNLLYHQAVEAGAYINNSEKSKTVLYKEIEKINKDRIVPTEIAKKLSEALEKRSTEEITTIINTYIDETSNDSEYAKKTAYVLANTAEKYLNKNGRSIEEFTGKTIWDKIAKNDTIPNLKQCLLNLFIVAIDIPNSTDFSNDISITDQIKKIIETDFKQKITTEYISKRINYSPQYLNVIFKKNTGKTIFEYLTEYRVEKAKVYLQEPDAKIYLISQMVGYSKLSHFRTIFKKHTGLSPQDYKQQYCPDEEID